MEFLENKRSRENQKSKSPEKRTFLSPAFYNAASLHIVELRADLPLLFARFAREMARIQKKEGLKRTTPNRHGPSPSLATVVFKKDLAY